MFLNLEVRSYSVENPHHDHDFAQWVLPVHGRMEIDVNGHGGYIDHSLAALVAPGSVHSQLTDASSRFLVLDCSSTLLESVQMERLAKRIYVPIPAATRRLIEFADLIGNEQLAAGTTPLATLLVSSFGAESSAESSILQPLIARVRAYPAGEWNNQAMARVANMSLSQLHQRFRQVFAKSPQAWLTELRINDAQRWLRSTALPISDIALRSGFSDQAALTRAMQRVCSTTPAVYRKTHRQSR